MTHEMGLIIKAHSLKIHMDKFHEFCTPQDSPESDLRLEGVCIIRNVSCSSICFPDQECRYFMNILHCKLFLNTYFYRTQLAEAGLWQTDNTNESSVVCWQCASAHLES